MDIGVTKSEIALEAVRYDAVTGLVPVVVQSVQTGAVLMVAYANREALKRTLGTGEAWYWSRSRQEYWRKGATSGNTQKVMEVRLDCDGDSVLYLVEARGPACHTGEVSCFYRSVHHEDSSGKSGGKGSEKASGDGTGDSGVGLGLSRDQENHSDSITSPARKQADFDMRSGGVMPERISSDNSGLEPDWNILTKLWQLVVSRDVERPNGSYTTYLFEHGVDKIAKKVGEEAAEVVIAAKNASANLEDGKVELAKESADLLFHLLALWRICKIAPDDALAVLDERGK